jgi:DmsE family decaheme c-type cytochrome
MLAALLVWSLSGPAVAQPGTPANKSTTSTGADSETCRGCHTASDLKAQVNHSDCQSCHRDTAVHLSDPMKGKPTKAIASEICLSCHATGKGHAKDANRMNFAFSEHNKAGVQCSDCHGIHSSKVGKQANVADVKMDNSARLCATCHQDVLARFTMPSHHPLREGAVSCTSCHQPHDGKQAALGGRTEQCTKCHQAVRGPHVFEHPPAAEDCTNCHNPHGTPNRRLLEVAQPMMCLQCHSVAGNRHGQAGVVNNTQRITGAVLRDCVSCHGALHGSSTDQHLRH